MGKHGFKLTGLPLAVLEVWPQIPSTSKDVSSMDVPPLALAKVIDSKDKRE